jgi:hypothetical protein
MIVSAFRAIDKISYLWLCIIPIMNETEKIDTQFHNRQMATAILCLIHEADKLINGGINEIWRDHAERRE